MAQQDFYIQQGEEYTLEVTIVADDNSVVPIGGTVSTLTVKRRGKSDTLFTVTGVDTDAPNGVTTFEITAANTAELGHYLYRVQTVFTNGDILKTDVASWYIEENF